LRKNSIGYHAHIPALKNEIHVSSNTKEEAVENIENGIILCIEPALERRNPLTTEFGMTTQPNKLDRKIHLRHVHAILILRLPVPFHFSLQSSMGFLKAIRDQLKNLQRKI